MNASVLVDGRECMHVSALDRGLLYGDGLFETIRFVRGSAPLWAWHMCRLREGCLRLGIAAPEAALLAHEAGLLVARRDGVVRITLTRGAGERGYAPPAGIATTRIVAVQPLPPVDADWYRRGIRVRSCGLRLARQPRLAGIKHLNRLEQVLARAEWSDPDVVEGLLFDHDERLISATAANVFGAFDGALVTPALDECGVAGVMRAVLLEAMPHCVVRNVAKEELMHVDEMFLTSSVRGVLPVREFDGRKLGIGAHARVAMAHCRRLGLVGAET